MLITKPRMTVLAMVFVACLFVAAAWGFTLSRIQEEYDMEIKAVTRTNSNLAKAFEENVRQNLRAIDEILRFLQEEYRSHGQVTPEMEARMRNTGHIPTVHVSMINEQGGIFASSLQGLVGMDVSSMEYFEHFRRRADNRPYFGRPIVGRLTGQPLFHMSRILLKADGSFAGALNCGVEPRYFAEYYNRMEMGGGYAVSLVGLDGFVRVRRSEQGMSVGDDVRAGPAMRLIAGGSLEGNLMSVPSITQGKSLISYRVMPDYPFAVLVILPEKQFLADFNKRRTVYVWIAAIMTLGIAVAFIFLFRMFTQKMQAELSLANSMVEHRARQLLQEEVALAGRIQAETVPGDYDDGKFLVRTLYKPAHFVSGDSYNYEVSADKNTVRGYLIDVTGHGISTALQTAAVGTILVDELNQESHWSVDSLVRLENRIRRHLPDDSFVAALLFSIDCDKNLLHVVIAGINRFLLANGESAGWVTVQGGYLGVSSDMQFGVRSLPFHEGDAVYFMTDGLYDKMMMSSDLPVKEFEEMMRRIRAVSEAPDCRDDMTAVGITMRAVS